MKRSGVLLPVIFSVVLNRVGLPDDMRPFGVIDLRHQPAGRLIIGLTESRSI